jgi:hypothetical protein
MEKILMVKPDCFGSLELELLIKESLKSMGQPVTTICPECDSDLFNECWAQSLINAMNKMDPRKKQRLQTLIEKFNRAKAKMKIRKSLRIKKRIMEFFN